MVAETLNVAALAILIADDVDDDAHAASPGRDAARQSIDSVPGRGVTRHEKQAQSLSVKGDEPGCHDALHVDAVRDGRGGLRYSRPRELIIADLVSHADDPRHPPKNQRPIHALEAPAAISAEP